MKKIFISGAVVALLLVAPQEVQAQKFLKKLKDKVEQKVDNAIGGALGIDKGNDNKQETKVVADDTDTSSDYIDEEFGDGLSYAESLLSPKTARDRYFFGSLSNTPMQENGKQLTLSQASKMRPGFFTGVDVFSAEGEKKVETAMASARQAVSGYMLYVYQISMERAQQVGNDTPQISQGSESLANFGQEMMAYMQSHGIDMNNPDEAKMEKVAMQFMSEKLGIPVSVMQKIQTMNPKEVEEYLTKNYPEAVEKAEKMGLAQASAGAMAQDNQFQLWQSLQSEVDKLIESEYGSLEDNLDQLTNMANYLAEGSLAPEDVVKRMDENEKRQMTSECKAMLKLHNDIVASWPQSETCKKVDEMEAALGKRLSAWMEANNKGFNDAYPSWWDEGRKEQNKLINAWNLAQQERWNAELKKIDKGDGFLKKLIAMEAKIDSNKGALSKQQYYELKMKVLKAGNTFISEYFSVPFSILDCPQAASVPEEGALAV